MKILRKKKLKKNFQENFFFLNLFFSGFSLLRQETLDMGVFTYLMRSPDCKNFEKNICRKVIFRVPEIPPLFGVFGAWMTFKKVEMAKTRIGWISRFSQGWHCTSFKKKLLSICIFHRTVVRRKHEK